MTVFKVGPTLTGHMTQESFKRNLHELDVCTQKRVWEAPKLLNKVVSSGYFLLYSSGKQSKAKKKKKKWKKEPS